MNTTIQDEMRASETRFKVMHLTDAHLVKIDDETFALLAFEANNLLKAEFKDEATFLAYWRRLRRTHGLSVGTGTKGMVSARSDESGKETEMRQEWNGSSALQEEFGGVFSTYAAFRKADRNGLVRIAGRKDSIPKR